MNYFKYFPKVKLPYRSAIVGTSRDKRTDVETVDLTLRYRLKSSIINNKMAYYNYNWKDNDRPDKIAALYYGDVGYAWIVMLSAQVFDYTYDFPLPQNQLDDFIESTYNMSIFEAQSTVHHYEDEDGYIIDLQTYTENAGTSRAVSIYDYEHQKNEDKRVIKLISREYVPQIMKEFEDTMRKVKKSRDLSIGQQVI